MGEQLDAQEPLLHRDDWVQEVRRLVEEIIQWSEGEGWPVQRGEKHVTQDAVGPYDVPTAVVRVPGGQLHVEPVGMDVVGADGRVDLDAWPTLNRVKVLRRGEKWVVYTDSNVPLREPWGRDAYVQLARDLVG